MSRSNAKLSLPQINRVQLKRFSLFTASPNAEFETGDGVLCLIGANGIGKSTLLSAINFCLTGIVPDPDRSFESMDEYLRFSRGFSSRYFLGRITGNDKDEAEIEVSFRLGSFDYTVRRGMFEPDELRGLTIRDEDGSDIIEENEETSRSERHELYTKKLVEDSGVSSFQEFVFLQHFVFTFDEQRNTLFWDQRALEPALYRAFGIELDMAQKADSLRREIESASSQVRNSQWDISKKSKRLNKIMVAMASIGDAQNQFEKLVGDHESLTHQFAEENKSFKEIEGAQKNENLRLVDLTIRESALREEYNKQFEQLFDSRPIVSQHPLIVESLEKHRCGLCGDKSDTAINTIATLTDANTCPICDSKIQPEPEATPNAGKLKTIDQELGKIRNDKKSVLKTLSQLGQLAMKDHAKLDKTAKALDDFNSANSAIMESLRLQLENNPTDSTLSIYKEELDWLRKEKDEAYDLRERLKKTLYGLQDTLERGYQDAENEFVPRFSKLAQRFLGMPLTVQLESKKTGDLGGLKLVVSVKGVPRPLQQQLSESQKFFLDIALRMALTDQISLPDAKGGMYIDTPEGSLDIAYEKRAGDMLATFAEAGHRIIMTANLNSSQLLLELAKRCGEKGMRICRMTDWAELSEVQIEEEDLFNDAFQRIELAMKGATPEIAES